MAPVPGFAPLGVAPWSASHSADFLERLESLIYQDDGEPLPRTPAPPSGPREAPLRFAGLLFCASTKAPVF